MSVRAIHTFPDRGEAGLTLPRCEILTGGLEGDRPKRAAVSLVGSDAPATRANLVLDVPTAELEALAGQVVRLGGVVLAVEATGNACPGLYAQVGTAGAVTVGDVLEVVEDGA